MLLIAMALQSTSMAAAAGTAEAARPRVVRATLRRSARPAPSASPLLGPCERERDCANPASRNRFRLTNASEPVVDRKLEMLRAAEGPNCNRTGMPVCPASGHRLLRLNY